MDQKKPLRIFPLLEPNDDLALLLAVLPEALRKALQESPEVGGLVEVVMDLGRRPEARFPGHVVCWDDLQVGREEIDHVVSRVGEFTGDNRAGIERTLHRISALRNRRGEIIGLTCRVGRAVTGTVAIIRDVIETGSSLLLLGPPGVGKTTLLREAARVLADELDKRVVIVDTSNEIAGDGDVPHHGIGRARRLQVPRPELQHRVMIEAVENHMPEVIVIDEIGTLEEALAARTIAERGVQLVGTAHGITLDNLVINPTLSDLIGGIQPVTLSDDEARRRGTQKTVLERKAPPTFDVLVEIQSRGRLAVYHGLAEVVDRLLAGIRPRPEVRIRTSDGQVQIETEKPFQRSFDSLGPSPSPDSSQAGPDSEVRAAPSRRRRRKIRIYPIGINRTRLERGIRELGVPARLADQPIHADVVVSLKVQRKRQPKKLRQALEEGVDYYTVKSNTLLQVKGFLCRYFQIEPSRHPDFPEARRRAIEEAEDAVVRVQRSCQPIELAAQDSTLRRRQHEFVHSQGLFSRSRGRSPYRRVVVFPAES